MRNALAIVVVVLVIMMAAVSVISYDMGSSVNSKSTTVTDVITQLRYVTTTVNNTVVMLVSQTPQQALTFTVMIYHESLGILTMETSGSCTVTILPVSTSTSTYTEYRFPVLTKTIGNTIYAYDFNETISSYFNATIITVTAVQGELINYINSTYYDIPILRTTVSASTSLLKNVTLILHGIPPNYTSSSLSSISYRTLVTSTCPEFTTQG